MNVIAVSHLYSRDVKLRLHCFRIGTESEVPMRRLKLRLIFCEAEIIKYCAVQYSKFEKFSGLRFLKIPPSYSSDSLALASATKIQ